ncbi:MAG: Leucyl aminopeptidase [Candidatus Heimdallarchaeota archaeon LC_3]|nr:MAG: Leucyl aminopeptidase [Candidatus Heimdallarchaeota archaeon LC_3]
MKNISSYSFCQEGHIKKNSSDLQFVPESAPRHYSPDLTILCRDLDVNIHFKDLTSKKADVTAKITVSGMGSGSNEIRFNAKADSIKISQLKINNTIFNDYSIKNDKLIIHRSVKADETIEITVDYLLDYPKSGIYWIIPDPKRPQRPSQIWTQGESEEARYWLPCIDSPMQVYPTKFTVKVPNGFDVLSNGKLLEKIEEGDETVFVWYQDQPHPAYLITLCIGKFVFYEDAPIREEVPLRYFADKDQFSSDDLYRSFKETPQMIKFLSEKLNVDYAWAKYHQVVLEDFTGAMENTSATSWFWDSLLSKDESEIYPNPHITEEVNIHELAHQWFGDLVVIKHWASAYLKEGMVTYLTSCYLEEFYGKDVHFLDMYNNQEYYLKELKTRYARPIVHNKYNYSFDLFDDHTYPGGAWRFHMIRRIIGDKLWWKTLTQYLTVNRHKSVESMNFIKALDEISGINFREFFDDWVFSPGVPDLKIQYSFNNKTKTKLVVLNVEQSQAIMKTNKDDSVQFDYDKLFKLDFQIGWLDKDHVWHYERIHIPKQLSTAVSFPVAEEPLAIYINSNLDVLMEYKVKEFSTKMHKNLAEYGPDTLSRFLAIKELIKKEFVKESKFITKIIKKEADSCIQSFRKMIHEVGEIRSPLSFNILKSLIDEKRDKLPVVASVIPLLGKFQTEKALELLLSFTNHHNTALQNLAIRQLGSTQFSEKVFDLLKENVDKPSWNSKMAINAINSLGDLYEPISEIVWFLLDIAEQTKYHFNVRTNALQGIISHASMIDTGLKVKIIPRLEVLLSDPEDRISRKSASVLSNLKSFSSKPLIETMINTLSDGLQNQMRTVMENFGKDDQPTKELTQLRKEIFNVSKTNKELKEKLLKLETIVFSDKKGSDNQK